MTIHVTNEQSLSLGFDYETLCIRVIHQCMDYVDFPYEAEVEVTLVDVETIHEINLAQRQIDRPTDVLSFPMLSFEKPGDFSKLEENMDNFHPESGEALLGDIVLCIPKVKMQAEEYGHSYEREFAFLICHSMLHLFGYDHMVPSDEEVMFAKQEEIMQQLGISR
ncbi:probable rRNA maturation factor [Lachnospiraceae bacterium XBB1006]|nr:probable rRNA maturation factor [Lachnospiraceae bacterium XBB1006]